MKFPSIGNMTLFQALKGELHTYLQIPDFLTKEGGLLDDLRAWRKYQREFMATWEEQVTGISREHKPDHRAFSCDCER